MNFILRKVRNLNISKIEISLFFVAVVVRVAYSAYIQSKFAADVFTSFSDAERYLIMAKNIAFHHSFSEAVVTPELIPDAMRTILYPLFLAFFALIKAPIISIVFVQNIFAGVMAILIYRLSIKLFDLKSVGLVSALFFSLDPAAIYWTNLLMSGNIASLLFLAGLYSFFNKKYGWTGLFLGMTTLTRPIFLYLFPLFLLMYVYLERDKIFKKNNTTLDVIKITRGGILMLFVFLLTLFPWSLRNKIQFDTWAISSNGWVAIHAFISPEFASRFDVDYYWPQVPDSFVYKGLHREVFYLYEFSNADFYKNYLFDLIKEHPTEYVQFHITSAIKGLANSDYDYLLDHVILPELPSFPMGIAKLLKLLSLVFWYTILLLTAYAVYRGKKRHWMIFFISFPILNNLLTGYISMGPHAGRYMLPFLPIFLILASYGLMIILGDINKKRNVIQ